MVDAVIRVIGEERQLIIGQDFTHPVSKNTDWDLESAFFQ
jgi:hypothetical protein